MSSQTIVALNQLDDTDISSDFGQQLDDLTGLQPAEQAGVQYHTRHQFADDSWCAQLHGNFGKPPCGHQDDQQIKKKVWVSMARWAFDVVLRIP